MGDFRRYTDSETVDIINHCVTVLSSSSNASSATQPLTTAATEAMTTRAAATPSSTKAAVGNICREFHEKNTATFEDMFTSLQITEENARATFEGVVNELFSEGITWSRIMAMLTFASLFASKCSQNNIHSLSAVIDWTTKYAEGHWMQWVAEHGGWEGFVKFFNTEDVASSLSLKKVVCGVAAGALGALTIGAFLASRS